MEQKTQVKFILKNKKEDFENFDIKFKEETFREAWLAGKYLIDVEIRKLNDEETKAIEKEYYCSILKKDKEKINLYLAHLDKNELERLFNKQ